MNLEQPSNNIKPNEGPVEYAPEGNPLTEKLSRIYEVVEKKYGIKCPPLTWNIFFGHHQSKKDFEDFIATADNPDIFVMENAGWHQGALELYRKISNGEETPEKIDELFDEKSFTNEFSRAFADWVYQKKLPIVSLEADDKKTLQKISNIDWELMKFNHKFDDTPYYEAVSEYSAIIKEYALAQVEREEEIMDNIPDKIGELLQTNQALQEKENLKIKMFYGAFHTALSHQLIADGQYVSREFQKNIMPHDPFLQLQRYYRFNKTPPPELEEKVLFLELTIHDKIQDRLLPTEEAKKRQIDAHVQRELRRRILAAMSIEDMRHYYEMRKSATPEEKFKYINSFLEKNK